MIRLLLILALAGCGPDLDRQGMERLAIEQARNRQAMECLTDQVAAWKAEADRVERLGNNVVTIFYVSIFSRGGWWDE